MDQERYNAFCLHNVLKVVNMQEVLGYDLLNMSVSEWIRRVSSKQERSHSVRTNADHIRSVSSLLLRREGGPR